mmetsp:Transcript_25845/g.79772  ORF Transcript_25845/g.79772 Transcript_25845/m.79772 type:complete len:293 (+) Transcript_25845:73-951(+)
MAPRGARQRDDPDAAQVGGGAAGGQAAQEGHAQGRARAHEGEARHEAQEAPRHQEVHAGAGHPAGRGAPPPQRAQLREVGREVRHPRARARPRDEGEDVREGQDRPRRPRQGQHDPQRGEARLRQARARQAVQGAPRAPLAQDAQTHPAAPPLLRRRVPRRRAARAPRAHPRVLLERRDEEQVVHQRQLAGRAGARRAQHPVDRGDGRRHRGQGRVRRRRARLPRALRLPPAAQAAHGEASPHPPEARGHEPRVLRQLPARPAAGHPRHPLSRSCSRVPTTSPLRVKHLHRC